MAANFEILVSLKNSASPGARQITKDITDIGAASKASSAYLQQMAQKAKAAYDSLRSQGNIAKSLEAADRAGRNLRVGLSSVDQVARVLGADLSGVIAPITGIADGIGDISGAINELGLGVGIIGGLVAAFAALNSVMQQRNQQIRDQILKNSELAKSIRELGLAETEAQKKLEELADAQAKVQTGWSFDLGDILANWEKFDIQGRTLAIALHAVGIELKDINPAFESSAEKAARLTKELKDQTDAAYKDAYALAAAQRVAESIGDTRKEAIQDYHDLSKGSYDLYQNTWLATHEFKEGVGWVHKLTAEEQQAVDQAKRLREQWQNVVKSIAASVLKPTEVTEAEQKRMQLQAQLAKIQQRLNNDNLGPQQSRILQQQATDIQNALNVMGPYVDQWDEYARRLEAIKAAAQEGVVNPDWAKMIPPDILAQGTQAIYAWADAEEKAFYNGQRLNEINYSGLADRIQNAISDIVGEYDLMQAAQAEVQKQLQNLAQTDPAKYQKFLKAENLAPDTSAQAAADAAWQNIADANQPAIGAAQTFSDIIKDIPTSKTTELHAKKAEDYDDIIDKIKAKLSEIPTNITTWVNVAYSGGGGGSGGGGSSGAPPPPPPTQNAGPQQHGGQFMVGGVPGIDANLVQFRATRGETVTVTPPGKAFGGVTVVVQGDVIVDSDQRMNRWADRIAAKGRAAAAHGL